MRPTDLATTTPALFFTRWITHFCAPTFVLLAGTAAYMYGASGRPRTQVSWFLATRGAWLIVLELTVIRFAWTFNTQFGSLIAQVIWAIGWSMIILAGLVGLGPRAVAAFGIGVVALHNLFDGLHLSGAIAQGALHVLHVPGSVGAPDGLRLYVLYPLVPWIGVIACGYAIGPWMTEPIETRRRRLWTAGLLLIALFVILRAVNRYGDPEPWSTQRSSLFTLLSFINTTKYPPSLLFLAMTLGPALCALAAMGGNIPRLLMPVVVYGRVPLFYYVLHLYALHAIAALFALARDGTAALVMGHGRGLDMGLVAIYSVWLLTVVALYPACRWFAEVKRRRASPLLSYL